MTQIPPRGTPEFEEYKRSVEEAHWKGARIEIDVLKGAGWEICQFPAFDAWHDALYRIAPDQPQFFRNQAPEPSMTPTEQRIVKALDQIVYGLGEVFSMSLDLMDAQDKRVASLHEYTNEASKLVSDLVADLPHPSPSEAPASPTAPAVDARTGGSEGAQNPNFAVGDRVRHRSTGWSGGIMQIYPDGIARVVTNEGLVKDYPLTSLINLTRREAVEAAGKAVDKVLDPNVEAVREMLLQRSRVGMKKYGVTTDRDDLSELDWHRHHLEELLDAAVYVMRKIRKMEGVK